MGMQAYGNCELQANINKINENYNFKELWYNIQNLIKESEATEQEIVNNMEENFEGKELEIFKDIQEAIKDYITQAWIKLKIDIYPTCVDSEAEGTDNAGEIIWCIEPELVKTVKEFSRQWTTWSTYG